MNRQGLGFGFITLGIFTYISKYLVAAIFGSNMKIWTDISFDGLLKAVGYRFEVISGVLLLVGVLYLLGNKFFRT
ncbi:hypothetical protein ACI48J_15070 [Paenibacillus chitinolyticus]|uniref:hypothetical protein n=1 Tax=Paenibacillus chitinolyticus TaxID=79263 RepID=UPI00386FD992